MKIKVNETLLFELTDIQKKVIKNDIKSEIFDEDMKRRLKYVITHRCDQSFAALKREWDPKLAKAVSSVPIARDAFANLVFAQSDYKDKVARSGNQAKIEG